MSRAILRTGGGMWASRSPQLHAGQRRQPAPDQLHLAPLQDALVQFTEFGVGAPPYRAALWRVSSTSSMPSEVLGHEAAGAETATCARWLRADGECLRLGLQVGDGLHISARRRAA